MMDIESKKELYEQGNGEIAITILLMTEISLKQLRTRIQHKRIKYINEQVIIRTQNPTILESHHRRVYQTSP